MRRVKLVFATIVVLVAALAALAGPALAEECEDAWGYLIECDGQLYAPYNSNYYDYDDDDYYYYYPSFYNPFYSDFEDYEDFEDFVDDLEDNYWGEYYFG